MSLATRIREALSEIDRKQSDLARAVGISTPSVNGWLSGKTKTLKGRSLIRAAAFLNVNELWLSEGRGPKRKGDGQRDSDNDAGVFDPPRSDWPFPGVPESVVRSLPDDQVQRLEGAILLALGQMGVRTAVPPAPIPAKHKAPDYSDVEDPFPMALRVPAPWEGGQTREEWEADRQRALNIKAEGRVAANVVPGAPHAANDKFEEVPELADVRLAAGDPIENHIEDQTGIVKFRRSFLRSVGAEGGRARVVYAKGDSMEPVIHDGAALLLVPNNSLTLPELAAGGVYAINYDGKMIVKCVVRDRLTRRWVARSYNPAYADIDLEAADSVRVLGRVVWTGAKLPEEDGAQWVKT